MTALPLHNYFSRILACVVTRREFFCLDFARVAGLSRCVRGRTARGATLAILFSLVAVVMLSGCAGVGAWAQNNERTYRAEYHEGGGAISMSVRPVEARDEKVTRDQIERMFRELDDKRLPGGKSQISNFKSQIAPEGGAK